MQQRQELAAERQKAAAAKAVDVEAANASATTDGKNLPSTSVVENGSRKNFTATLTRRLSALSCAAADENNNDERKQRRTSNFTFNGGQDEDYGASKKSRNASNNNRRTSLVRRLPNLLLRRSSHKGWRKFCFSAFKYCHL